MPRPRLPGVLLAHPLELAIGIALVINGIRGAFAITSPSLQTLPVVPLVLYLVVSTLGGVGVTIGLCLRESLHDPRAKLGVTLERASLHLVAASYLGIGVLLVGVNGAAGAGQATITTVIALGCILRTMAIRRSAQIVYLTLRDVHREVKGE